MKKEVVKLLINGGILTLLTTPTVFLNVKLNHETKFRQITISKEELYSQNNITIEEKKVSLSSSNIDDTLDYVLQIEEYSNIFGLDSNQVLSKVIEYTDNFTKPEFLNDNQICDFGIKFENKEQAIIYFIRDIDMDYTKYGFDESVLKNTDYNEDLECEEMVEKYSEIFNIDKRIPMSIIYTESHYTLSSKNFNERNNPAGAGHIYYDTLEEGVIYHIINLKYNYADYSNDISFFEEAQSKYCPDNDGSWITFNENYYQILTDDYYHYLNLRKEKVLTR